MPSPFPGMNPYLEQDDTWHDFHGRFIPFLAEMLTGQLPGEFIVKIDEHVYIHEPSADERRRAIRPDVFITGVKPAQGDSSAIASVAPAYTVLPSVDLERESYVEIIDKRSREVITILELLSPSNKRLGPDREQYLAKRGKIIASPAHLVEFDLLRGGPRLPSNPPPGGDYNIIVSRVDERPKAGVWSFGLRDPLPVIPVPVRPPHSNVSVDVRKLIDRIYDGAGYDRYIYDTAPEPALSPADLDWARAILARIRKAPK